jgi:hypothetical protein
VASASVATSEHPSSGPAFPQHVLNVGFYVALGLSMACFLFAAIYLFEYLSITNSAVEQLSRRTLTDERFFLEVLARLSVVRFCLSACGICTGLAFGFLGFSLFLIGVRSQMDVGAQHSGMAIQLSRIAPGTFIMLCSVVLIALSMNHNVGFNFASQALNCKAAEPVKGDYHLPFPGSDRKP